MVNDGHWVVSAFFLGLNENIVKLDSDDSYTVAVNMLRLTCFKGMNGMLCEFSLNYAVLKTPLAAFHYLMLSIFFHILLEKIYTKTTVFQ